MICSRSRPIMRLRKIEPAQMIEAMPMVRAWLFLSCAMVEGLPQSLIEAKMTLVRSPGLPILLIVPMKAGGSRWIDACHKHSQSNG